MRRARWRSSLSGVLAAFLVAATAVGGCTRSGTQDAAAVVADPALQQILQHVPADTPYAFVGMGGPGTREFITKLYEPMQKLLPQLEAALAKVGDLGLPEDKARLLQAVVTELKGKLSVDGLASLGIDVDARMAFYGLGVLPAMRMQLRDPAALRDAIERVQTSAGVRFPTAKLGDVEYWQITGGPVEGAVAIVGDQLVAGVAPVAHKDRVFALLFGSELPAQHLGKSEKFQQMLADHGLAKVSAGYFDARILAEAFLGEGDALNKDVLAALAPSVAARWPELDATCKQEIRSLVALAPRAVFGTEQIDASGFAGKFVLELRPDVAQELMTMRASVPGVDPEAMKSAVFAMGGGFDMERALTFAQTRAMAIQAAPYQCPALADLNKAASDLVGELKTTDPEVWKIRGGALVLDDLKLAGFLPSEVRGFVSLAYTDTKGLMPKLQSLVNQPLSDDGSVSNLPDGTIPMINNVHYGLHAGRGGVLAVGPDSQARAKALLAFTDQPDPPMLVMVYDMGRFADLMNQMMSAAGTTPPEMAMFIDFYKIFGSVSYDARASERGLVMRTSMALR